MMASCIKKVEVDTLGISRCRGPRPQESYWWNKEVQKTIKMKKEWYGKLIMGKDV